MPDEELFDESFEAYAVVLKVLKGRSNYKSLIKNGIKSRKLETYEGHSIKIEKLMRLDWIGSDEELYAMAQDMPTIYKHRPRHEYEKLLQKAQIVLSRSPENVYKQLNDAIVFNLCLEPASLYNLCRITDKSRQDTLFEKLQRNVLYLETNTERFEISIHDSQVRVAKVLSPRIKTQRWMATQRLPLEAPHIEIIAQTEWSELIWSDFGV